MFIQPTRTPRIPLLFYSICKCQTQCQPTATIDLSFETPTNPFNGGVRIVKRVFRKACRIQINKRKFTFATRYTSAL